jgi:hypothetical protein
MIRWIHAAALGLAASLLVPSAAFAQSLADVAAREKERRSGQKAKSYSEDDLRRAGGSISSFDTSSDDSTAPAEAAAPAEGGSGDGAPQPEGATKEKTEDEQRAAQEKTWRDKVQKAQESLNSTAAEIAGIQKSLADNTGNYYSASRTNMLNRMDGLTKKYAAEKDALDSLREEGRRSQFRE